ncbi:helix-turn-helix transcriptional regulator [Nocardioides psychrotolerans]|uniref:helix-turn-helix transcriptional regulator n=1 Tax=Nocardioides psychrotolerans TaxID=1005945 RepID=UPI000B863343
MNPLRLAGVAEVAELLGVSRQQVHRLASREDFPAPVANLVAGRVWLLVEVEQWGREHAGRRPGRPETPKPT